MDVNIGLTEEILQLANTQSIWLILVHLLEVLYEL